MPTDDRLLCRAVTTCKEEATYLVPQKNTKGTIGWLPVCWDCSKDWFKSREVLGEILELDTVEDTTTRKHLGIK